MVGTREISTEVAAALDDEILRPVYFWRGDFKEGIERVCSAPYSIHFTDPGAISPQEYFGVGALGTVSTVEEGSELNASGASVTLNGCDPAQLALSLNSTYQGRSAYIWMGLLDENHVLINAPILLQRLMMDTMPISLGKSGTVTVNMNPVLIRWETASPVNARYTDADHQAIYPGDRGFEFTSAAATRELTWGRA